MKNKKENGLKCLNVLAKF